jgi:rhamnose transport system ATP-binding protein
VSVNAIAATDLPTRAAEVRVELRGIGKAFDDTYVVRDIDLKLASGEVHALVGENGAGKSTIVKILGGIHRPDQGQVYIDGQEVTLDGPKQASAEGIRVVHQEPTLFPDLDVAENIFIGRQPRTLLAGIDWRSMYAQTRSLMRELLPVELDPHTKVGALSIGERQIVEIVKALALEARVVVLDEPTAALSAGEVDDLFGIVERLRARGVAILFVGHRLEEIEQIADQITVLRDGRLAATARASDLTREALIRHMVGREMDAVFPKVEVPIGKTVLTVRGLSRAPAFHDISFDLHRGEILGFAGLIGAGRSEIARALFGIERPDAGTIAIDGAAAAVHSPGEAVKLGLALVPEDRHGEGLILDWSIEQNLTLAMLGDVSRRGLIRRRAERSLAKQIAERYSVRYRSLAEPIRRLSGGNQQKIVIGKWLATNPRVLILDEPTRGVDIQTKAEVHRRMSELAAAGVAIILISSELPEVIAMADRTIVLREGRITGEFSRAQANQESLMSAATRTDDAA